MISIDEFAEMVQREFEFEYDDVETDIKKVIKDNGITYTGVNIRRNDELVSPTFYVDDMYERYTAGEDFYQLMKNLFERYEDTEVPCEINAEKLTDFEFVKEKIFCKLVNFERNEILLRNNPYYRYLDFALTFRILICTNAGECGSVLISNDMVKEWGVSIGQLYEMAKENTLSLFGCTVMNIRDLLFECLKKRKFRDGEVSVGELEALPEVLPMYVLTNERKMFGASSILFEDRLFELANDIDSDLYALPSSLHEWILVPADANSDVECLKDMVMTINSTEVSKEDFLSDNVYFYDRKARELSIAT